MPESTVQTLHIRRPRVSATTMTELDGEGMVVMEPRVLALKGPLFKRRLLMYFASGWADRRLCLATIRRHGSGTLDSSKQMRRKMGLK